MALYHPQAGFYSTTNGAGRKRDFLTSPEVGDLFAQVIARALDVWWQQYGRPNPFYVIEVGAGSGTLAASIIKAEPACSPALRYLAVEQSFALRSEHTRKLPLIDEAKLLDPTSRILRPPVAGSFAKVPPGTFNGVVLANELLDNLPVDIYERRGREWREVRIALDKSGDIIEKLTPVSAEVAEQLLVYAKDTPDGGRIPLQHEAQQWLRQSLDSLVRGKVVAIDYMRTTRWMAHNPWDEWLRTYRNHRPGSSPFDAPGDQDITCEVAIDQLSQVARPKHDRSQTEFLEAYGLLDIIADARDYWHAKAEVGDLAAVRARAKVQEGRALTDEDGLGRYRVVEWDVINR